LGTCETESYVEKIAFTRACLSSIRVFMVIMCVPFGGVAISGDDGTYPNI
jgi:hypothetical protein